MRGTRETTRQRIIETAYVLFWKHGFARTSVDEIAAAAQLSKRTLYSHFESKDLLLTEVMEAQNDLALAAFDTFSDTLTGSPDRVVEKLFRDLEQ